MTTVTVEIYKESGKWNKTEQFQTITPVYESMDIEAQIEDKYQCIKYTWEAVDENSTNKRMVSKII